MPYEGKLSKPLEASLHGTSVTVAAPEEKTGHTWIASGRLTTAWRDSIAAAIAEMAAFNGDNSRHLALRITILRLEEPIMSVAFPPDAEVRYALVNAERGATIDTRDITTTAQVIPTRRTIRLSTASHGPPYPSWPALCRPSTALPSCTRQKALMAGTSPGTGARGHGQAMTGRDGRCRTSIVLRAGISPFYSPIGTMRGHASVAKAVRSNIADLLLDLSNPRLDGAVPPATPVGSESGLPRS